MAAGIAQNVNEVRSRIAQICARLKRPEAVELVAVSKTVPPERVLEAYQAGVRNFGENKVQEYLDKKDSLPEDAAWHLIGHLQTNKTKFVVRAAAAGRLALLQSLDRPELAREIEKQARQCGLQQLPCLIQVNSSGEDTKGGFRPEDVEDFVSTLTPDSVIGIRGLMTIGPLSKNAEAIRECFSTVRQLRDHLRERFPKRNWDTLSMGMSADYEIALEEGSTLVRIGSAIFGVRI